MAPSAKSAAAALADAPAVRPLEENRRRLGLAQRSRGGAAEVEPVLFRDLGRRAGADQNQPVEIDPGGCEQVEDGLRLAGKTRCGGGAGDRGFQPEAARLGPERKVLAGQSDDGRGEFAARLGEVNGNEIGHDGSGLTRKGLISAITIADRAPAGRYSRLHAVGLLRNAAIPP